MSTFSLKAGLLLILPTTILLIVYFFKIAGMNFPYNAITEEVKISILILISVSSAGAALLLNLVSLAVMQSAKNTKHDTTFFLLSKTHAHLILVMVAMVYGVMLFLISEFDKFGNIPVGRD